MNCVAKEQRQEPGNNSGLLFSCSIAVSWDLGIREYILCITNLMIIKVSQPNSMTEARLTDRGCMLEEPFEPAHSTLRQDNILVRDDAPPTAQCNKQRQSPRQSPRLQSARTRRSAIDCGGNEGRKRRETIKHDDAGWPPILLHFDSTKVHTNYKPNSRTMTLIGSCMCGGVHYSADGSFIGYRDSRLLRLIAC